MAYWTVGNICFKTETKTYSNRYGQIKEYNTLTAMYPENPSEGLATHTITIPELDSDGKPIQCIYINDKQPWVNWQNVQTIIVDAKVEYLGNLFSCVRYDTGTLTLSRDDVEHSINLWRSLTNIVLPESDLTICPGDFSLAFIDNTLIDTEDYTAQKEFNIYLRSKNIGFRNGTVKTPAFTDFVAAQRAHVATGAALFWHGDFFTSYCLERNTNPYSLTPCPSIFNLIVPDFSYWCNYRFSSLKDNPVTRASTDEIWGKQLTNEIVVKKGEYNKAEPQKIAEPFNEPEMQKIETIPAYCFKDFDFSSLSLGNTAISRILKYAFYNCHFTMNGATCNLYNKDGKIPIVTDDIFSHVYANALDYIGPAQPLDSFYDWSSSGLKTSITNMKIVSGRVLPEKAIVENFFTLNNLYISKTITKIPAASFRWNNLDLNNSKTQEHLYIFIEDISKWAKINFENSTANPAWNHTKKFSIGLAQLNTFPCDSEENFTHITSLELLPDISNYAFYNWSWLSSIGILKAEESSQLRMGKEAFFQVGQDAEFLFEEDKTFFLDIGSLSEWCQIEFEDEYSNPWYALLRAKNILGDGYTLEINLDPLDLNSYWNFNTNTLLIPDDIKNLAAYTIIPGGKIWGSENKPIQEIVISKNVTNIDGGAIYIDQHIFEEIDLTSIQLPFVGHQADYNESEPYKNCFGYIFGYTQNNDEINANQYSHYYNNKGTEYWYKVPATLKKVTITGGNIHPYAFNEWKPSADDSVIEIKGLGTEKFKSAAIGEYAFYNCNTIKTLILSSQAIISKIDSSAFEGCSSMTVEKYDAETETRIFSLFEPSVEDGCTIGENAFKGCSSLATTVILPRKVHRIEVGTFNGCSSIQNITVPFLGVSNDSSETQKQFYLIFGESVEVPSSLENITILNAVSGIAKEAFSGSTSATSITIYDCGKKIEESAFEGLTALKFLNFEMSGEEIVPEISDIGAQAFSGCEGLSVIAIPDSVRKIGMGALYGCNALTQLSIPFLGETEQDTENNKMDYLFTKGEYNSETDKWQSTGESSWPTTLTDVTIDRGEIGAAAFTAFQSQEKSLNLTLKSVGAIGESAFEGVSYLKSINIPYTCRVIGSYAFKGCTQLQEFKINNASPIVFKVNAFFGEAEEMEKVGGSICYITSMAKWCESTFENEGSNPLSMFERLYILTDEDNYSEVTNLDGNILKGVKKIGSNVFAGLSQDSFSELIIPDTIQEIGKGAFAGCTSITTMTLPFIGKSEKAEGKEACLGWLFSEVTKADTSNHYYRDDVNTYYFEVPSITTIYFNGAEIKDYALTNLTSLTSINLYNARYKSHPALNRIGKYAFDGCNNLFSSADVEPIEIKAIEIEEGAFRNCFKSKSLSLIINNALKKIGKEVFKGCTAISELNIPFIGTDRLDEKGGMIFRQLFTNSRNEIDSYAPQSLKVSITNATQLKTGAFRDCSFITDLTLNDKIIKIGDEALYGCSKLSTIAWPASIEEIGRNAIVSTSLTEIDLSSTKLIKVGAGAFYKNTGLKTLKLPSSVLQYAQGFAVECPELIMIELPYLNEYNISSGAYNQGGALAAAIGNQLTTITTVIINRDPIKEGAFYGASSLTEITLPAKTESIPNYAFTNCTKLEKVTFGEADQGDSTIELPHGLNSIGVNAFNNCPQITKIIVPETVKIVEHQALATLCDEGTTIIFEKGSQCEEVDISSFNGKSEDKPNIVYLNSIDLLKISQQESSPLANVKIYCPMKQEEVDKLFQHPLNCYGIDNEKEWITTDTDLAQKDDFDYAVCLYDNNKKAFLPIPNVEVCYVSTDDWRTELYYQGTQKKDKTFSENYYYAELNAEWSKIYDMRRDLRAEDTTEIDIVPCYHYSGGYRSDVSQDSYDYWLDFIEGNNNSNINLSQYNVYNIGRRTKVVTDTNTNCVFAREVPNYTYVYRLGDQDGYQNTDANAIQISTDVYNNMTLSAAQNSAFTKTQELLLNYTQYGEAINLSIIPIYHLDANTRISIVDTDLGINGDYLIKTISLPLTSNGVSSISATKCVEKTI